jgi:hypothetical protein
MKDMVYFRIQKDRDRDRERDRDGDCSDRQDDPSQR